MLRSFLIYLSQAAWAKRAVTGFRFAWRAASRFVAGEKLEDAIQAVRVLNEKGILASLDYLGEHTTNEVEAKQATENVVKIIEAIQNSGIRSNVSLKLTQIGLAIDPHLCADNLACILKSAKERGILVRLDMEDTPWVDATLDMYWKMRRERELDNVGVVIQSYLYRSEADIRKLTEVDTHFRLCKGAYKEPASVAFPKKSDVDENYDKLVRVIMDSTLAKGAPTESADGKVPPIPAIATHDIRRIEHARMYAEKIGLPKSAIEFQMLYGIRRDLQEQLVSDGYPVRVYVPYGTQWYPYFMRRLAERPANLWFFISNFFKK